MQWCKYEKRIRTFFLIVFTAVLFTQSFFSAAQAAPRAVRVGYPDTPLYMGTAPRLRSGYMYDYLQELADYADWKITYVGGTWPELIEKLQQEKIDVLAGVPKLPAYKDTFAFANCSMGVVEMTVVVPANGNNYVLAENGVNGLNIGFIETNPYAQVVLNDFAQKGFMYKAVPFDSRERLNKAMERGEVDAILSMKNRYNSSLGIAAMMLDPQPIFLVTNNGRPDLMDAINYATGMMQVTDPQIQTRLYRKYLMNNAARPLFFTDEEKNYLKEKGELVIVAAGDQRPYCYFEDGELKGILGDVISRITSDLGIRVRTIETADYVGALKLLHEGKADILANFFGDYGWADQNNVRITQSFIFSRYATVVRKNEKVEKPRAACVKNYFYANGYVEKIYPRKQILYYDTVGECLDAVADGRADVTFINTFLSQTILQQGHYRNLQASYTQNLPYQGSMAVNSEADPLLLRILNKEINHISAEEILRIVNKNTLFTTTDMGLTDIIYRYPIVVLAMVSIVGATIIIFMGSLLAERKKHLRYINEIAYVDKNTGCSNQRWLEECLPENFFALDKQYAVFVVSIKHMDLIIERYGFRFGNKLMQHMADLFRNCAFVKELGVQTGEGRCIAIGSYKKKRDFKVMLEQLASRNNTILSFGINMDTLLKIGVYFMRNRPIVMNKAIGFARQASFIAMKRQENVVVFDEIMEKKQQMEQNIESRMHNALAAGEFKAYYQPQYDMQTNRIFGAEALVRWEISGNPVMMPDEFITIFEQNGFITYLDFYMLEQVCKFQRRRLDKGLPVVPIAVNQSRLHMSDMEYSDKLQALIDTYRLPAGILELELTETVVLDFNDKKQRNHVQKVFEEMHKMGFRTALDDFGSGYSSMLLLDFLPWNMLKLDRSFLNDLKKTEKSHVLLHHIIKMVHELDINVICEGIETEEQAKLLQGLGCRLAQGFFYARPMTEEKFAERLGKEL